MDIDDLIIAMLSAIEESHWIVIARNPQYLALQYVVQLCKATLGVLNHFLLIMRGGFVIAVGNISTD